MGAKSESHTGNIAARVHELRHRRVYVATVVRPGGGCQSAGGTCTVFFCARITDRSNSRNTCTCQASCSSPFGEASTNSTKSSSPSHEARVRTSSKSNCNHGLKCFVPSPCASNCYGNTSPCTTKSANTTDNICLCCVLRGNSPGLDGLESGFCAGAAGSVDKYACATCGS